MNDELRSRHVRAEKPERILARYMADRGLKSTRQRSLILETFFNAGGHLNVEELLAKVREEDSRVSAATVYRTMKLLTESGIANARNFGDGQTRFEIAGEHHDHLICTTCGRIVEFEDEGIEARQAEIARAHGFTLANHKMELYGVCSDCAR
ncbi:Fur family transcriptional regulator [Vulgatibacter incomptus]|uniref:Ferric uptake regulation protein n=1 Tax=Vulgatibacter incomptus TaxID=1391653 RepID=A0A0K1PC34_9BACT|nr:Fur family transcriptional regulator [Vulgatibacter incomptus]AKU91093.1 Ferric uptake regulation protein FUR [Vulgatibacter incomptus]